MKYLNFYSTTADGQRLFNREWLPEQVPRGVVCLVHGLGEHAGRYEHLAGALTTGGYVVLAPDLRGHGRSEGKRGHTPSYEALLDDIDLLINLATQRFPGSPIFLYGHSLGGNLVLNYALRRKPVLAGVIATSPWLRLSFNPPALQVKLARIFSSVWPGFTQASGLDTKALCHDQNIVAAYEKDLFVHNRISLRLFTAVYEAGLWALNNSSGLQLPLLLMHGSEDKITSAEASREFSGRVSGDCTLRIWHQLFHETHNEPQKDEIFAVILEWLQAHQQV